jgi:hypothetical protein
MGFVGGLLGALASSFSLVSELGTYVWAIIAGIVITDVVAVVYIRKKRKKHLETTIQGWLPKEPTVPSNKVKMAETKKVSKLKPRWWKPYWIALVIITIALEVANYFFLNVPLERATIGLILALLCMGFAYYIRVRPSIRVNKALYILLGITPIGFLLWIVWAISGISRWITDTIGAFPSLIISWAVCCGIGALIGNWIGKRRNYRLPLSL